MSLRVITLLLLILVLSPCFIQAHDEANEVLAQFKAAREARQKEKKGKTAMVVPDTKQGDMDFETRRAALLAQAEQNIPAERDLEWEKQLQEDRRSLYFDRDRSIMDDPLLGQHVAGIHPADL